MRAAQDRLEAIPIRVSNTPSILTRAHPAAVGARQFVSPEATYPAMRKPNVGESGLLRMVADGVAAVFGANCNAARWEGGVQVRLALPAGVSCQQRSSNEPEKETARLATAPAMTEIRRRAISMPRRQTRSLLETIFRISDSQCYRFRSH